LKQRRTAFPICWQPKPWPPILSPPRVSVSRRGQEKEGPLLSNGLVLSRISAPISTLAAFEKMVLTDANAFGQLRLRYMTAAQFPDAATLLIAASSLRADRTLGLTSSRLLAISSLCSYGTDHDSVQPNAGLLLEKAQKDPELSAAINSINKRESECLTTLENTFRIGSRSRCRGCARSRVLVLTGPIGSRISGPISTLPRSIVER